MVLPFARGFIATLLTLAVVAGMASKVWVPRLIEQSWYGQSIGPLNRLMALGHGRASLHHYLDWWSEMSSAALVVWVLVACLLVAVSSPKFYRRFVGPATPEALGAVRILVCSVALINALWEDLASSAMLPSEMRAPMGILQLLYRLPIHFDELVSTASGLRALQWVTITLLTAALAGLWTRWTVPLAALAWMIMGGICRQYDHFYHTGLLPTYLLAVLSCTPCGDGLSLDRLRRQARGLSVAAANVARPIYGWSRYACWATLAMAYLLAALSKLRGGGVYWWNAASMRAFIFNDALDPRSFHSLLCLHLTRAPDFVFAILGLASLGVELSFVLVLFSATARRLLPLIVVLMHLGILFLQDILFFDFIVLQLMFLDYDSLKRRLGRTRSADQASDVFKGNITGLIRPSGITPFVICGIVPLMAAGWVCRREVYPLTAWPMYAEPPLSVRVQYLRLFAHHRSGAVTRAQPDETIGALADGRYRRVLWQTFSRGEASVGKRFLVAFAAVLNRGPNPDKVVRFELQRWEWDMESHPEGPQAARLVGKIWVDVGN